jgi:N6-L-threonylcarbamoyladenine synthase
MNILGIETSCDDTGVAIVKDGREIIASSLYTQKSHKDFGGVVPEIASRMHLEVLPSMTKDVIYKAGNLKIDKVAVTQSPGLSPALLVGISFAHALSRSMEVGLIEVNHLYAHVYANIMSFPDIIFPHISLLVSGGHTQILKVSSPKSIEIIGTTVDDAAGEAFDKVARMFGLGYPGGQIVSNVAERGDENKIKFPRALDIKGNVNFSFSGLKTSVFNFISHNKEFSMEDILASFQYAVIDILVRKTIMVAKLNNCNVITIAGGVAANKRLREEFLKYQEFKYYFPSIDLCSDNAVTVAGLAYHYKY